MIKEKELDYFNLKGKRICKDCKHFNFEIAESYSLSEKTKDGGLYCYHEIMAGIKNLRDGESMTCDQFKLKGT